MGNKQRIQIFNMPDEMEDHATELERTFEEHPAGEEAPNRAQGTTETCFGEESLGQAVQKQTEVDNVSLMSVSGATEAEEGFRYDQLLDKQSVPEPYLEELLPPYSEQIHCPEVKAEGALRNAGHTQALSGALDPESDENLTAVQNEEGKLQMPLDPEERNGCAATPIGDGELNTDTAVPSTFTTPS